MSAKHTVQTDALDTLGSIIGPDEKRDAIHLAVFPAVASTFLNPGEHVLLQENGEARVAPPGKGVGIVDPFLTDEVGKGERFWLVVYPRQITSLRHVWEHPNFPESGETGAFTQVSEEKATLPWLGSSIKDHSEQWLRNWHAASDISDFPFETLVEAVETGEGFYATSEPPDYYDPYDNWRLTVDEWGIISHGMDAYGTVPAEFWVHMENYLGHPIKVRPDTIGCSC